MLGIRPIALILTLCLALSAFVGFFFMPDTTGKSLERIEEERRMVLEVEPGGEPAKE